MAMSSYIIFHSGKIMYVPLLSNMYGIGNVHVEHP
jgi:hypothetical protein